jgi:hypothetical protein
VPRVSLTLVAKILPVLGGVAIALYLSWCIAISMVGGTIPLVGWTLEGGFWTFLLWGLLGNGVVSAVGRLALLLVIAVMGRVMPLSMAIRDSERKAESPPAVSVPGYDPGLASLCALASMVAYKSEEESHRVAGAMRLSADRIAKIEHQNHSCTLLGYADFIILAFRGTVASEVADWKTNWQTKPVASSWEAVQHGETAQRSSNFLRFLLAANALRLLPPPECWRGHSCLRDIHTP